MREPIRFKGRPARERSTPLTALFYASAVALATFVTFIPALGAGFVNFDDDRVVVHNPYLRQSWSEAWRWMWTTTYIGHYQPLTWASLFVDSRIGGALPWPYHLTSVLLHAVAAAALTVTLATLLRLLPGTRDTSATTTWFVAAAAAMTWSVHPLRVESVAWIAERRDPLSVLFWLLALHGYLRSRDPSASEGTARRCYLWSCAALALSLLAKAWGMSFVFVLIAVDWVLGRTLDRRAWLEKIPFAVMGAAAALLAWFAQRNAVDTMVSVERWSWVARVLQACYGLCFYLWKTILPTRLAALYELPRTWHDMSTVFIVSAMVVLVAAVFLAARPRRNRGVAAAAAVYAITLAPVLGFAQSGPQLVADRYAYVAALPIAAVVAAFLVMVSRRVGLRTTIGGCVAVILAFGVMTWRQTAVWHDSIALWRHAIDTGNESYLAHFDLGQALRAEGRLDEALEQYRLALERRPEAGNAWYVYGNAMKAQGRLDEAEAAYKRAYASADPASIEWMLAHVNLGNLYFNARRFDAAAAEYRAAIAQISKRPEAERPPEPYLYLGMALGDRGDVKGARDALAVALRYPSTRARAEQELRRLSATESPRN